MLWGVMFCQHRPLHDERAVRVGHAIFKAAQIDGLWWGGDLMDLAGVSRWPDAKDYAVEIQEEFDSLAAYFKWVRKFHRDIELVWQDGNHEARIDAYLRDTAFNLRSLRCLTLSRRAHVGDFGIRRVHEPVKVARGEFILKHGAAYGEYAGRNELKMEGRSGMCSHNHRMRLWSASERDQKPKFWYHGGCLLELPPKYGKREKWWEWQQGVSLLWIDGRDWSVEQIPIYKGKALWRGRSFTA